MPDSSKNLIKRFLGSKLFLFLIILFLIAVTVNVGSESYQKYQLNQEIDNFKIEIEELEKNNKQLADLMEYLKKEPYLEREARLKLNLMKPGEKVIILPDESIQEASVTENIIEGSSEEETANYWEWWQYFFSR